MDSTLPLQQIAIINVYAKMCLTFCKTCKYIKKNNTFLNLCMYNKLDSTKTKYLGPSLPMKFPFCMSYFKKTDFFLGLKHPNSKILVRIIRQLVRTYYTTLYNYKILNNKLVSYTIEESSSRYL